MAVNDCWTGDLSELDEETVLDLYTFGDLR